MGLLLYNTIVISTMIKENIWQRENVSDKQGKYNVCPMQLYYNVKGKEKWDGESVLRLDQKRK